MADKEKIELLEKKINGFKFICRLAGVPNFLIENPEVLNQSPITAKDIEFAKKAIEEYEKEKTIGGNEH